MRPGRIELVVLLVGVVGHASFLGGWWTAYGFARARWWMTVLVGLHAVAVAVATALRVRRSVGWPASLLGWAATAVLPLGSVVLVFEAARSD